MLTKTKLAGLVVPALAAIAVANIGRADASANASDAARASTAESTRGAAAPAPDPALQLVVAPDGNEVRYRVREQLVGVDFPNDAVGATRDVTGGIAFDSAGQVLPSASKFTANVATLKSDRDRRDGYVRGRTLETDQFPTVTLVPTAVRGISFPLPTSGSKTFQLVGDLTVKGVTKPTTWQVDATFDRGRITGNAATTFTFADFGLEQPRVRVLLSVADTIKLEYTFSLVPKS
jgi:polyisoprenoid-binding protein YceI